MGKRSETPDIRNHKPDFIGLIFRLALRAAASNYT